MTATEGLQAVARSIGGWARLPSAGMAWFPAPDYWLSRWLVERALGAIYLVAFLSNERPTGEQAWLRAIEILPA